MENGKRRSNEMTIENVVRRVKLCAFLHLKRRDWTRRRFLYMSIVVISMLLCLLVFRGGVQKLAVEENSSSLRRAGITLKSDGDGDIGEYNSCTPETVHGGCEKGQMSTEDIASIAIWMYINMDVSNENNEMMKCRFSSCGISSNKVVRVPAVTGMRAIGWNHGFLISARRFFGFAVGTRAWSNDRANSRPYIKVLTPGVRWEDNRRPVEVAVVISHLRAVKMAYDLQHETALVFEDDTSFEYVHLWQNAFKTGLKNVKDALEREDKDWDICQLSMTIMKEDIHKGLAEFMSEMHKGNIIKQRHSYKHKHLFGAIAMLWSRHGMKRILDTYWPGGASGLSMEQATSKEETLQFNLTRADWVVSDFLLYEKPLSAFVSCRPLFPTAKDDESARSTRKVNAKHRNLLDFSRDLFRNVFYNVTLT